MYVNEKLGDKSDLFGFRVSDGLGNTLSGQSYQITITPDPTDTEGEETTSDSSDDDNDEQNSPTSVRFLSKPTYPTLRDMAWLR